MNKKLLLITCLFANSIFANEIPAFLLIHDALLHGYPIELLDQIINDNKLDINEPDQYGRNVLVVASSFERHNAIRYFYDHGIDINSKDKSGRTALHWVASWGKNKSIKLLLEYGADSTIQDNFGKTAYNLAKENNHKETQELLQEYGAASSDYKIDAEHDLNSLDSLIRAGNISQVRSIISPKNINNYRTCYFQSLYEDKATPLLLAAAAHNFDLIKYFLEIGANPNTKSSFGRIPLHEFAISCYRTKSINLPILDLFYNAKTDFDSQDCLGMTAFHIAACTGRVEVLKAFAKLGVDIHKKSYCGSTALHYAVAKNHIDAVKFLIGMGLRPDQKNNLGFSPQDLAYANNYEEIQCYITNIAQH